jgi:hypothetical protein
MFMVDLAVPRDIESEVKALPVVYLYTVGRPGACGANRQGQPPGRRGTPKSSSTQACRTMHCSQGTRQRRGAADQQLNAQTDAWRALEITRAKSCWPEANPWISAGSAQPWPRPKCCTALWPSCTAVTALTAKHRPRGRKMAVSAAPKPPAHSVLAGLLPTA